jgi:16S rRNA (adenine1518-N6/adenine1519-N6)-dimethyltransferase
MGNFQFFPSVEKAGAHQAVVPQGWRVNNRVCRMKNKEQEKETIPDLAIMPIKLPENIKPKQELDQHFLVDMDVISAMISAAEISKEDTVVDVGAGIGTITRHIPKCRRIIAIEIDRELVAELNALSRKYGFKAIEGNALKELHNIEFTKLISNLPYMISEPLLRLLFSKDFKIAVLLLPKKFTKSIVGEKTILGFLANNFFEIDVLQDVMPASYEPQPDIVSCLVRIKKKPANLVQRIYLQEGKLVKNALREALVLQYGLTKRQAREKIEAAGLPKKLLEKSICILGVSEYKQLEKFLEY